MYPRAGGSCAVTTNVGQRKRVEEPLGHRDPEALCFRSNGTAPGRCSSAEGRATGRRTHFMGPHCEWTLHRLVARLRRAGRRTRRRGLRGRARRAGRRGLRRASGRGRRRGRRAGRTRRLRGRPRGRRPAGLPAHPRKRRGRGRRHGGSRSGRCGGRRCFRGECHAPRSITAPRVRARSRRIGIPARMLFIGSLDRRTRSPVVTVDPAIEAAPVPTMLANPPATIACTTALRARTTRREREVARATAATESAHGSDDAAAITRRTGRRVVTACARPRLRSGPS